MMIFAQEYLNLHFPKIFYELIFIAGLIIFLFALLLGFRQVLIYKNIIPDKYDASEMLKEADVLINYVPIEKAVYHVAKFLNPQINFSHLHITNDLGPACDLLVEKFRNGELMAKGKKTNIVFEGGRKKYKAHSTDENIEFSQEDWTYRTLKPLASTITYQEDAQTESYGSEEDLTQLTALKVDFNKVKKLWPVENT